MVLATKNLGASCVEAAGQQGLNLNNVCKFLTGLIANTSGFFDLITVFRTNIVVQKIVEEVPEDSNKFVDTIRDCQVEVYGQLGRSEP